MKRLFHWLGIGVVLLCAIGLVYMAAAAGSAVPTDSEYPGPGVSPYPLFLPIVQDSNDASEPMTGSLLTDPSSVPVPSLRP